MSMIIDKHIIDGAYNHLSCAYYIKRDRKAIEDGCKHCQSLGIPNFHALPNAEMTKLYSYRRIKTYPVRTSIECLPSDVFSQPIQFQSTDVLYTHDEKRLTVGDFLTVIKYALTRIDVVYPENNVTPVANPTIWELQGVDEALNNKPKTELTNHSRHISADFLASSVKESLNDTSAKRSVAVSTLMVNLVIDFLVKDH